MIGSACQRWRDRIDRYRPAGERIATHRHEVAAIADDTTARAFVEQHHYSGSFPAARYRFGLYRSEHLVGIAVLSHPITDAALRDVPGTGLERTELGRLVLLDDVPGDGESWFVARAFELARAEGIVGVLSLSDPLPRRRVDGTLVAPGHVGVVYQALNGVYRGRATARTLRILPDGTTLSARAISKLRAGERGWRYVVDLLERHGAPPFAGDRWTWGRAAIEAVTHTIRHPGNHRYVWGLDRRARRHLPTSLPYPRRPAWLPIPSLCALARAA